MDIACSCWPFTLHLFKYLFVPAVVGCTDQCPHFYVNPGIVIVLNISPMCQTQCNCLDLGHCIVMACWRPLSLSLNIIMDVLFVAGKAVINFSKNQSQFVRFSTKALLINNILYVLCLTTIMDHKPKLLSG